ncbi:MAG: NAD-dependent epimerase/dehydratase family protein [Saprospiraceae bacterium]|nr:NAD-dependent epimerase/dehydratase family protein [Saprospiraceae bacterium]
MPVIIVRPSNAYGIGQVGKRRAGFIAYAMQSILGKTEINIFGAAGTIRDYIYVTSVTRAIRFSLDKAKPELLIILVGRLGIQIWKYLNI